MPWLFDDDESDPQSAADVLRRFTKLKAQLMPTLLQLGVEASERGTPTMRPMLLEFPDDAAVEYLDRQYMLGADLLVAPVFSSRGDVSFYLPEGRWVSVLTGEPIEGGRSVRQTHDYTSVPLYLRPGGVVALANESSRPENAVTTSLLVHPDLTAPRTVTVADGEFRVERVGDEIVATGPDTGWTLQLAGGSTADAVGGVARVRGA